MMNMTIDATEKKLMPKMIESAQVMTYKYEDGSVKTTNRVNLRQVANLDTAVEWAHTKEKELGGATTYFCFQKSWNISPDNNVDEYQLDVDISVTEKSN